MSSTFDQHCGQCGNLLPPGSTSCPNCGAPVSAPPPGAATPPSSQPSEYFPGMVEQMDSAETMVRLRPDGTWDNQPSDVAPQFSPPPGSGVVAPSSPPPGSGMFPLPGQ